MDKEGWWTEKWRRKSRGERIMMTQESNKEEQRWMAENSGQRTEGRILKRGRGMVRKDISEEGQWMTRKNSGPRSGGRIEEREG